MMAKTEVQIRAAKAKPLFMLFVVLLAVSIVWLDGWLKALGNVFAWMFLGYAVIYIATGDKLKKTIAKLMKREYKTKEKEREQYKDKSVSDLKTEIQKEKLLMELRKLKGE